MSSSEMPAWLAEPPIAGFQQRAAVRTVVYESTTPFQKVAVYDTVPFGRALVLEGAVQTTARDEFVYHEMIAHPALFSHPHPKRALIIGGGDGGALRRVLEHRVERAVMVEIDRAVVDVCRSYLPEISDGAFGDPRAQLLIADGTRFVAETDERFDVVLVDSTDPVGPAQALFGTEFYTSVHRVLAEDGLVVTQSGSPLLMRRELSAAAENMRKVFPFVSCYLANIPSYPGCLWSFLVGAKDRRGAALFSARAGTSARASVRRRFIESKLTARYYSPEVHFASCALPPFLAEAISPGAAA